MDINKLSSKYKIRKLNEDDIELIYQLSVGNPMYYQYYPPFVTREIVLDDMYALPPNKSNEDKFYIGFFDDANLVAVMDLILRFPNEQTSLIGLFMMNKNYQGKGIGSGIIEDCIAYLQELGYARVRLGYAKGNPQSEAFWTKNGFVKTGEEPEHENCTVVVMERELTPYTIEPANSNDITEITAIYNSNEIFLQNHLGVANVSEDFILKEFHEMENVGFTSSVIKKRTNKIVGVCDFKISEEVYLSLLMIDGTLKKRGIGSIIYNQLETFFKSQNAKSIRIDVVYDYEENVLGFWEKQGFTPFEKIELEWNGYKSCALTMRKRI